MIYTLDLRCGVSGDMLLAALLDVYSAKGRTENVIELLSEAASVQSHTDIGLDRVKHGGSDALTLRTSWEPLKGEPVTGREMTALMERAANRTSMNDRVKKLARRMLTNLIDAERSAHNVPSGSDIHLHEAGTPDTLVDLLGIAYVYDRLELDGEWIRATPLSLGSGVVEMEHGNQEVPVPAVRHLLRPVPAVMGPVKGELATPTGVSAVMAIVEEWMDEGDIKGCLKGKIVGRGAGTRTYGDFPNVLEIREDSD